MKMTESKRIFVAELNYEKGVFQREGNQEPKNKLGNKVLEDTDYISEQTDKTRENIRWEKSMSYYFLHPEKFNFQIRDL